MNYKDVTPAQIQDWKAKYGQDALSLITFKSATGEDVNFVVVPPSRAVMDILAQHGASKNVQAANNALIKNCVLAGDLELMERDGSIYSSLLKRLNALVVVQEGEIKKL